MADELSIDVPRHERGPALARAQVRDAFAGRMSPRRLDDLLVVVSELTTNALLHGSGPIRLCLQADGRVVRGEVIDAGRGFEREVGARGIDAVGGHGLHMVGRLAGSWGIHEGSSHVWFEISPDDEIRPADPQLGHDERPDELDG